MSDAFILRWKLDRPFVVANKSTDVYVLLSIEPNPHAPVGADGPLPAHLIVLMDVSGSMDVLVRHDPRARKLGETLTEGRASERVISKISSRREMACQIVQKLAERLGAEDLLTLVAFDDKAYVLAEAVSPANLDTLWPALQRLGQVGGGGTQAGAGLQAVRRLLAAAPDPGRTRKLLFVTDGEDETPSLALRQARDLARELNVPIVALGTGECRVAFLKDMAKTTLAGSFNHIRSETDADQMFLQVLSRQKNVEATAVVLLLELAPGIRIRELYRTQPEILYVGDVQPDANYRLELRLEQMERGKAYEFLFRCSTLPVQAALPGSGKTVKVRLARARLAFDLPARHASQQLLETDITIEYTNDAEQARAVSGDVRRVLARAEVQRQLLFIQAKADVLKQRPATERDNVLIARVLKKLLHKFQESGDQPMINQCLHMQEELMRDGIISQEMLNRSLAASSRAEQISSTPDIDF